MTGREKLLMVGGGLLVAVCAFMGFLLIQHVWLDHDAVHQFDRILGYNLRIGRIVLPEGAPAGPAPTQTPTVPPAVGKVPDSPKQP